MDFFKNPNRPDAMNKRFLDKITQGVLPLLASFVIRLLALTMRIRYVGFEDYKKLSGSGKNAIGAFWHGRLLMMPYAYFGKKGVTILVSRHRDGELIVRTVKRFGIASVRGSTTRGWIEGVKGLLESARSGKDLAITPDGPRGPARKAQMGAVQLAKATGLPIIPVTFSASKKKPFRAGTPS